MVLDADGMSVVDFCRRTARGVSELMQEFVACSSAEGALGSKECDMCYPVWDGIMCTHAEDDMCTTLCMQCMQKRKKSFTCMII